METVNSLYNVTIIYFLLFKTSLSNLNASESFQPLPENTNALSFLTKAVPVLLRHQSKTLFPHTSSLSLPPSLPLSLPLSLFLSNSLSCSRFLSILLIMSLSFTLSNHTLTNIFLYFMMFLSMLICIYKKESRTRC